MFQKLPCLPYVFVVFLPVYSLFEMFQKISCLPYVFTSVLACAKPAHAVFQKLSYLLCRLCLSLSSLNLPQTVRLFNISLHSQAPQQQYTVLSFSSTRRHGHSHKLTFHVHYGITSTAKTPGNHILGCLSCISVPRNACYQIGLLESSLRSFFSSIS